MFRNDINAIQLGRIIIIHVINVKDASPLGQKSNGWAWMRDKGCEICNNSTEI